MSPISFNLQSNNDFVEYMCVCMHVCVFSFFGNRVAKKKIQQKTNFNFNTLLIKDDFCFVCTRLNVMCCIFSVEL